MQRSVNNFEITAKCRGDFLTGNADSRHRICEVLVLLLSQPMQQALALGLFTGNTFYTIEGINLQYVRNNLLRFIRNELSAFGIIHFIAVVLRRVMACGNYYASSSLQMAYSEAQLWCGPQGREQMRFNAVSSQYKRSLQSELR
ncbi:hypothetical protein D3C80_1439330 [compost metagenome]